MKLYSRHLFAAFIATSVMASCSRPVAYFQLTAHEQFKTAKTEAVVTTSVEITQPVTGETAAPVGAVAVVQPVEQIAQAKDAVSQIEAYVRNDSKLASNKKLSKRLAHVNELLNTTTPKAAQKTSLIKRMMLKRVDKKIKNHLSPEKPMAKSLLTIGLIVGIIGLILLLLSVANPLGLIALIVGLALVLVDLLR